MEPQARARGVPLWCWPAIALCAAACALAIDRGATLFTAAAPTESPFIDGLLAMLAVVVAAASAFACALLGRSGLPLRVRGAGCAAMLAATAICLRAGAPPEPALAWREVRTPSGRFRVELPGAAAFAAREVAEPGGPAVVREAEVRAGGLVFRVEEWEATAPEGAAASGSPGRAGAAAVARVRARLARGGAQVLAEERAPDGVALTVRMEGRRFRVRVAARGAVAILASAGPEGVDDGAVARMLGGLAVVDGG